MRIDSHQHFWSLARDDYGWLTPDLPEIHRDFAPHDLRPLMAETGMDLTVAVQAAPTVEETEYLLGIADATDFVAKVVGWVDIEDVSHRRHLERFARHRKFAGFRPMVQDVPDPDWILRPSLAWALDACRDLGLTFDALGFPVHGPRFLRLFARYPDLRVVIDHGLKPAIRDGEFTNWAETIRRIAAETGAFCKLSGLVTEAGPQWSPADLRPYVDCMIEAFGSGRVMWGSDWPVVDLASGYVDWHRTAETLVSDPEARSRIFGLNAARFYGIA